MIAGNNDWKNILYPSQLKTFQGIYSETVSSQAIGDFLLDKQIQQAGKSMLGFYAIGSNILCAKTRRLTG